MDHPQRGFNFPHPFPDQLRHPGALYRPDGFPFPPRTQAPRPPQFAPRTPMARNAPLQTSVEARTPAMSLSAATDKPNPTGPPGRTKKKRKRRRKKNKVGSAGDSNAQQSVLKKEDEDSESSDGAVETLLETEVHTKPAELGLPSISWQEEAFSTEQDEGIHGKVIQVEPFLPLELPPNLSKMEVDFVGEALSTEHDTLLFTPTDMAGEDVLGCRVCHGTFFARLDELVDHLQSPEHLARQEAFVIVMRAIAEQILSLESPDNGLSPVTK
ncbi:hypothetical protein RvY_17381 [Ramazzottius varieornatus]|uniref:Uncharacterized protein n=1 Tax=Ramazzottius varieornatus TaxID=947166 RepID=A0A1D1W5U0_RAMVA|nr:hypothetical protein RvY_17381 [Ramazzottius varieornatus]